jgi:phage terminase large subunit
VNAIPEGATLIARGLDFGFTNDPTAIVDLYKYDGKLWLDELCYQRGMTNDKIAELLRGKEGTTVADSAEMKSITEIYNYGIRKIEPAQKGADSVRAGIDILRRYELMVTKRSLNLIYELRNYKWKDNKITGETMNEPVDKFNHLLDAVRYVALNKLSEKPIIKRPRARIGEV